MKRTIEKIVAYAAQTAEPDEIILFGSMARGTNNIHSDLDILIVTDECFQKKEIVERVEQFAREMTLKADVLVYSRNDLDEACLNPHSFLAGVLESGKIVYRKGEKYFDF